MGILDCRFHRENDGLKQKDYIAFIFLFIQFYLIKISINQLFLNLLFYKLI
ncbi:hypothetical protein AM1_3235 [Acaryochloris marina MBIC11017]|uniref:Uncharacterized protein n=1 Tax=Acaryochloris marina (strain MBIC 11017) TaxID=329726 RepID=B0CFS7_ACAM1|nr:hypothetical protein AM1_3235 [Acaryochloris marina MBIC11017]